MTLRGPKPGEPEEGVPGRDARERSRRALDLLGEALDLPTERRGAFLDEVRNEDQTLAAELEAMLEADDRTADFLDAAAGDSAGDLLATAGERRIGPWRTRRPLGRGGMGMVYLAERADGQFDQQVALKLIPRALDNPMMRQRFLAERQILARLQHPRIARLLDGGVTGEGHPYFAMELIEGRTITEHADAEQLDVPARLELFLQICEGVEHAHRNLIVHRDLKPANIMVTDEGVKLLDFGIAKTLEEGEEALTRTGLQILTPEYASPEQVRGEQVTTQSDVYALGLILYELLCGARAHRVESRSAAAIERAVCEIEPRRPSAAVIGEDTVARSRATSPERLRRALAGDLDTIVLKALRKEPAHRYASVEALAADVRCQLSGLPVAARDASLTYRLRKFVRRHAWGVAGAAAIVALLTAVVVVSVASAMQITRALEQSRVEAAKAQETADFLSGLFEVADPYQAPGEDITARELLERGAERIRRELSGQPQVQGALMGEIGYIYSQLGLLDEADAILADAIGIQDSTFNGPHEELARNLHRRSLVADFRGEAETALALAEQALAMRRALHGEEHPNVGESMDRLASMQGWVGRLDEAEALSRQALETLTATVGEEDPRTLTALHNLAWLRHLAADYDEAAALYRRDVEISERVHGPAHPDVLVTLSNLAIVLRRAGQLDEAEAIYRRVLATQREALGDRHHNVGRTLHNLARLLQSRKRYDEASATYAEAVDIWRETLPPDHASFGTATSNMAQLESERGDLDAASRRFAEALEQMRRALPEGSIRIAETLFFAGQVELRRGQPATAERLLREAVAIRRRNPAAETPLAEAEAALGLSLVAQGAAEEAAELLAGSLPILEREHGAEHQLVVASSGALAHLSR